MNASHASISHADDSKSTKGMRNMSIKRITLLYHSIFSLFFCFVLFVPFFSLLFCFNGLDRKKNKYWPKVIQHEKEEYKDLHFLENGEKREIGKRSTVLERKTERVIEENNK